MKSCEAIQQGRLREIIEAGSGKERVLGDTPIAPTAIVPFHLWFTWLTLSY